MTPPPGLVAWTLTRDPTFGRTSHQAQAVCPHGSSTHVIFASETTLARLRPQLEGLALAHTMRTGCHCHAGPITVDGAQLWADHAE